jgi:hypothetical protein
MQCEFHTGITHCISHWFRTGIALVPQSLFCRCRARGLPTRTSTWTRTGCIRQRARDEPELKQTVCRVLFGHPWVNYSAPGRIGPLVYSFMSTRCLAQTQLLPQVPHTPAPKGLGSGHPLTEGRIFDPRVPNLTRPDPSYLCTPPYAPLISKMHRAIVIHTPQHHHVRHVMGTVDGNNFASKSK